MSEFGHKQDPEQFRSFSELLEQILLNFASFKVLIELGTELQHFVPSAKLHYIQCVDDVKEFYSRPMDNITEYAKLARDETVPENLAVRENPVRFHPNDKEAVHGGLLTPRLNLPIYYV